MHPSRRTLAIVAVGTLLAVVPVLVDPSLWMLWVVAWALLFAALVVDLIGLARPADVAHRVVMPDTLYMGEATPMNLHLRWGPTSGRRRAVRAVVKLDLSPSLYAVEPQAMAIGQGDGKVEVPLRPRRRGTAQVESAWLRWSGPLGLLERTTEIELAEDIDAVPNLRAVRQLAARFASQNELHQGLRIERYLGDGSEFDSLREFMPGFDRRSIDWKASARHTKLLSRHFRAERNRQIVLAVDTGHLMAEPLDGLPRLDHAIHAALLLAFFSARAGDRIGLYAFDERPGVFAAPRGGAGAFRSMLAVSGGLAYSDAETNFTLGLTDLMQRLTRRSLVVVLTDFTDSVTAELMVDNLTRLAARHLVVFVSLRDPLLARTAAVEPLDLVSLQRAVVADTLVRERETVVARLRRRGILCIDAAPGEVGMQLLDRYLEIKRREMI
ncbi:MAG: DUF58 domain-containing protein [Myxococcota bacterium]